MLSEDLLRKVHLIEINTRKVVDDVMSGHYRSHFKGHGVQFSEHRIYVAGDDVRHIDWKVSARTRDLLVKKFEEERELSVFLVVDISGSKKFGTHEKFKGEIAAEIGAMLAYAATHTGDRVGVMLFSDRVEKIIPPKKGKQHILRIIKDLLTFEPQKRGTDLAGALEATGRIMKHSGVVFILSDFMAEGYDIALKRLARKHDVVAITLSDERESVIPSLGPVLFLDPETGTERYVDTSSYSFRKWFEDYRTGFETDIQTTLKSSQVETFNILTKEDYGEAVVQFFRARARRKRR
ncbi:MAG: DUF58 domain-containing protein [Bdellovibrio sp.]|nr:DUF58 domain-containing protein [Bdellovibrio sp.]